MSDYIKSLEQQNEELKERLARLESYDLEWRKILVPIDKFQSGDGVSNVVHLYGNKMVTLARVACDNHLLKWFVIFADCPASPTMASGKTPTFAHPKDAKEYAEKVIHSGELIMYSSDHE